MTTEEKILTKHPHGKRGVNISRAKYDAVRDQMSTVLGNGDELTHDELMERMEKGLANDFDGSIGWYAETVKLDLEARGVIERTDSKPQRYRLVTN